MCQIFVVTERGIGLKTVDCCSLVMLTSLRCGVKVECVLIDVSSEGELDLDLGDA